MIAIGNGTASRETDAFVSGLLKELRAENEGVEPPTKVMVQRVGRVDLFGQ